MRTITITITLLITITVFTSCEREYYKPVVISQSDSVYFSTDIKPLLVTNCGKSGCHDAIKKEKGLNFEANDAYTTIMDYSLADTTNAEQSLLYVKINSGSMKSYSTPEFTAKLLLWIKQGAQDN
jgi:hypothetical protein